MWSSSSIYAPRIERPADVATVVIVLHPERDAAVSEAKAMVDWLTDTGHQLRLPPADAGGSVTPSSARRRTRLPSAPTSP